MVALLPVVVFVAMWLSLCRSFGWRKGFLLAAAAWGMGLAAMTELLGAAHLLTRNLVLLAWLVSLLGVALWLWLGRRPKPGPEPARGAVTSSKLGVTFWLTMGAMAIIAGTLLIVALVAPPVTYDSMTYHLARVMHWIQNQSVDAYPTHIVRQVQQCPFAEYVILHLQLLGGGDRFASLAQYFAMVGSVIAASCIAGQLGAALRGQVFAAVFCITIPMGILQATSTQNDYVAAFWLICMVALGFDLVFTDRDRLCWWTVLGTGAAMGLALFTKATAYLFVWPLALLLIAGWLWTHRSWAIVALWAMGTVAMAINAPHYARNIALTGRPLGPTSEDRAGVQWSYSNPNPSASTTLSNALRNLSLELVTPWEDLNSRIRRWVDDVHRWLNLRPSTSMWEQQGGSVPYVFNRHEDAASNPHHTVLLAAAIMCLPLLPRPRGQGCGQERGRQWLAAGYAAALLLAYGTFCLALVWMAWHTRLLLPLIVLGSPLVGLAMDRLWGRWVSWPLAVALLVLAIPYVVAHDRHPLFGEQSIFRVSRLDQRFSHDPSTRYRYQRLADEIIASGAHNVGLEIGENDWEYPIWYFLQEAGHPIRLEHVGVNNFTAPIAQRDPWRGFAPEIVVRNQQLIPAAR